MAFEVRDLMIDVFPATVPLWLQACPVASPLQPPPICQPVSCKDTAQPPEKPERPQEPGDKPGQPTALAMLRQQLRAQLDSTAGAAAP